MEYFKQEDNQRRHVRINHSAYILLTLPGQEPTIVEMKNFSNGGLFLKYQSSSMPDIGTIVKVQTTEFEGAPVQDAKVIRITYEGIALEFVSH